MLPPFCAPPAAIVYVMPTEIVRELGAWGEEYEIASGEDVDLVLQGVGQRSRRRVRPARARASTSARARRRGSTTGRRSGRATAAASSTSGWATARCPRLDGCDPSGSRATARPRARWPVGWTATSRCATAKIGGNRRFFAKNGPVRTHRFGVGARRLAPGPAPPARPGRRIASARPRAGSSSSIESRSTVARASASRPRRACRGRCRRVAQTARSARRR